MTVSSVVPDPTSRTLTLTADYASPVEQVWQLWADPRLLERWWGPPTYPATVLEHDLRPGGLVTYVMTGPEGQRHAGWWRVLSADQPTGLEFDDGFGEADDDSMPVTRCRVTITGSEAGSSMVVRTTFPSAEAMDQLLAMGVQEGMTSALEQTDALLASVAR